jgi:hypothetical protein
MVMVTTENIANTPHKMSLFFCMRAAMPFTSVCDSERSYSMPLYDCISNKKQTSCLRYVFFDYVTVTG